LEGEIEVGDIDGGGEGGLLAEGGEIALVGSRSAERPWPELSWRRPETLAPYSMRVFFLGREKVRGSFPGQLHVFNW
jgi:hypothetical protein